MVLGIFIVIIIFGIDITDIAIIIIIKGVMTNIFYFI